MLQLGIGSASIRATSSDQIACLKCLYSTCEYFFSLLGRTVPLDDWRRVLASKGVSYGRGHKTRTASSLAADGA
eukprot:2400543-Amphidinium_carterae.2